MMVIFFLSFVASLGKYAFRIQNPFNLLIVVRKTVLRWYTGEVEDKDIRFHTDSSHLSKQVSNSTGWALGVHMVWEVLIA